MGLQLRLTHPHGKRVFEVDERSVNHPIVVGHAADADVLVPGSLGQVSRQHCFLFVHQGRWFLQDAGTPSGTFCNGRPVTDPVPLGSGDVVTLGAGAAAPQLTIDPLGVAGLQASPVPPAGDDWPTAREAPEVPARPDTHFYIPGRKTASPVALTIAIVLTILILAGGGLWLRWAYMKREQALQSPVVIRVERPAPTAPSATRPATTRVIRVVRARPGSQPAATAPATMAVEPPPDPRLADPEWRAVAAARFDEPVLAIVKFYDFLERFPASPYKADVERLVDEAVDRIWWQRLIQLFEERDTASKEIDERKGQLALSQDPEFKKTLEAEIADWTDRRTRADETIRKEMNYQPIGPPNPYDSAALAALRAQRDAGYYAKWKADVLRAIKRSRGQRLPWKMGR